MKKIRIYLDVVLTILILTLYSRRFFGMHYHEVFGILILLLVLIHILINIKMLKGLMRACHKVPLNLKLCLIIDILLMLIFILIGLSGVLISKTILITLSMSSLWLKTIHLFFSGLALILLGIHIGLHLCRKEMYKGFAIVLSVISLCLGLYGFKDTQMQRWLTMPLTGQVLHVEENGLHLQGVQNGKGKGYGKGLHLGGGYEDNKEVLSLNQKLVLYSEFFGLMFTGTMATYWLVRINKTINSLSEKH